MANAMMRAENLAWLTKRGFKVAPHLPTKREGVQGLRSIEEIAKRLMALDVVFSWAAAPEKKIPTQKLYAAAHRNDLERSMTEDERAIFTTDRSTAHEQHVDSIGWRLENMWSLAWVLGFDREPPIDGKMIEGDTIKAILAFVPKHGEPTDTLMRRAKLQPIDKVVRLEDLFYCCHNAVRSAQLGKLTVPQGFDPVANGGVIHERRHALTWCLSPGTSWEDTDLST